MKDPVLESLSPPEAKALAFFIVENGTVEFTNHAEEELDDDGLKTPDCINLLRAGWIEPDGFQRGEWRYKAMTPRMTCVFVFRSKEVLRVITAWRNGQ